jgi:hypothetical protein
MGYQRGVLQNIYLVSTDEQFFSYLVAVSITSDRAENIDLCLACMAFNGDKFLRATSAATQDFRLYDLIQRSGAHVPQRDSNPRQKDHQIFTPSL